MTHDEESEALAAFDAWFYAGAHRRYFDRKSAEYLSSWETWRALFLRARTVQRQRDRALRGLLQFLTQSQIGECLDDANHRALMAGIHETACETLKDIRSEIRNGDG